MALVSTLVSVAQTSVALYTPTSANRAQKVVISNFSANNITVSGVTAVASTGVIIPANSSYTYDTTRLSNQGKVYVPQLYAISATGTNAVGVQAITEAA